RWPRCGRPSSSSSASASSPPTARPDPRRTVMAVLRDRPYVQFNFLVDLGTGTTDGPEAGFQECSNIGMEVTVSEYRNGNEKENSVRKITGMNKATDVTLKRGVIGSLNL